MLLWSGLIFKHNCIYNISIKVWTNKANKMSSKNVCTCYWNIPLIGLTLTHFCACPKPEPAFPTSYFMVFFVFNEWRWKGIVRFVDIGRIVDHHCLNFLCMVTLASIIVHYLLMSQVTYHHSRFCNSFFGVF